MTTMRVRFLPDGSVKLAIEGEVDVEIHDAVEMDINNLALQLGGKVDRQGHEHGHGQHHHHQHHHGVVRLRR